MGRFEEFAPDNPNVKSSPLVVQMVLISSSPHPTDWWHGIGGDAEWHDLDFERVAELFDERGLDDPLEAKCNEAELSNGLESIKDSECR